MSLWMVRAGRHGEYEDRFLTESRIYLTWDVFGSNACAMTGRGEVIKLLEAAWPNAATGKIRNHAGQIWAFLHEMESEDLVVVPGKKKPELHFGEIVGDCGYQNDDDPEYRHYRSVKWLKDIPRTSVDKDLLYSMGAIMTICQISRNDAEARIRKMLHQPSGKPAANALQGASHEIAEASGPVDYEQLARDEIATMIIRKFKGHDLERLVNAILRAQGYVTFHSPVGADRGVDILAGSGLLGFGTPRICVQVKSEQAPVDHPTFSQLLGTMHDVGADQGLLVSWSGFKGSIDKEIPRNFFKVRFWDQTALLNQLFEHYDELDEEIRAEIPLKRIWTIVPDETEADG